ncbi:hypothetical protein HK414_17640 [Ramlibacter terrae]|uniref:Tripartite tricarboxylate transporter substrate binding protein n=1 Tax=Ramlibacter terrae TaxID=2732511 RepID=A0ABX6P9U3_9BURK|nr:hypothetical protein HK414_17640 [Ramlibacter terrae]
MHDPPSAAPPRPSRERRRRAAAGTVRRCRAGLSRCRPPHPHRHSGASGRTGRHPGPRHRRPRGAAAGQRADHRGEQAGRRQRAGRARGGARPGRRLHAAADAEHHAHAGAAHVRQTALRPLPRVHAHHAGVPQRVRARRAPVGAGQRPEGAHRPEQGPARTGAGGLARPGHQWPLLHRDAEPGRREARARSVQGFGRCDARPAGRLHQAAVRRDGDRHAAHPERQAQAAGRDRTDAHQATGQRADGARAGLAALDITGWIGIFAPAGLPPAVLDRLNKAMVAAIHKPEMRAQFEPLGMDLTGTTAAEFAAIVRSDNEAWGRIIKQTGIKLDQ